MDYKNFYVHLYGEVLYTILRNNRKLSDNLIKATPGCSKEKEGIRFGNVVISREEMNELNKRDPESITDIFWDYAYKPEKKGKSLFNEEQTDLYDKEFVDTLMARYRKYLDTDDSMDISLKRALAIIYCVYDFFLETKDADTLDLSQYV